MYYKVRYKTKWGDDKLWIHSWKNQYCFALDEIILFIRTLKQFKSANFRHLN